MTEARERTLCDVTALLDKHGVDGSIYAEYLLDTVESGASADELSEVLEGMGLEPEATGTLMEQLQSVQTADQATKTLDQGSAEHAAAPETATATLNRNVDEQARMMPVTSMSCDATARPAAVDVVSKKEARKAGKSKDRAAAAAAAAAATAKLEVSSQLSRFHTEATETDYLGGVTIEGVSISIGDRLLLSDAQLKLDNGKRYGLIGQNGSGKSTLMRVLRDRQIPGTPSWQFPTECCFPF